MFADILVVLAVAITALDGKRRGLVKTFLGLFGTLAAAIAASFLKKPAYEFLSKTPLFENLRRSVESGVSEKFTADGAAGILSGAAKTAGDAAGSTAADIILPVISAVMVFIAVIIAFKILGSHCFLFMRCLRFGAALHFLKCQRSLRIRFWQNLCFQIIYY